MEKVNGHGRNVLMGWVQGPGPGGSYIRRCWAPEPPQPSWVAQLQLTYLGVPYTHCDRGNLHFHVFLSIFPCLRSRNLTIKMLLFPSILKKNIYFCALYLVRVGVIQAFCSRNWKIVQSKLGKPATIIIGIYRKNIIKQVSKFQNVISSQI